MQKRDENIEAAVQGTIMNLFVPDTHLYLQLQTGEDPHGHSKTPKAKPDMMHFTVDGKKHIKLVNPKVENFLSCQ